MGTNKNHVRRHFGRYLILDRLNIFFQKYALPLLTKSGTIHYTITMWKKVNFEYAPLVSSLIDEAKRRNISQGNIESNMELCRRFQQGDKEASELLLLSNVHFIRYCLSRMVSYDYFLEEAEHIAIASLFSAAKTYCTTEYKGSFTTWAYMYIRRGIQIGWAKEALRYQHEKHLDLEVADDSYIVALNASEDCLSYSPEMDIIEELSYEQKMDALKQAIYDELTPLERDVILLRYFSPTKMALREISMQLGRSYERVRQLEKRAILKLIRSIVDEKKYGEVFADEQL